MVGISSTSDWNALEIIQSLGGHIRTHLGTSRDLSFSADALLEDMGGLLLIGGPDIDPRHYGESPDPAGKLEVFKDQDDLELGLLRYALEHDMPVLAIDRGMQLLNVTFGGRLLQDIPGHRVERNNGKEESAHHTIYLSPGSKLAAILGMGGHFRVNSRHHQGLREAQKSPRLLASAYSLDDAIIEGLESPEHSWVVGVQFNPERQGEVPKVFANLFASFVERSEFYEKTR